jgi:squalene-hopene/tetraprenyl-beta-curcumene cyclase
MPMILIACAVGGLPLSAQAGGLSWSIQARQSMDRGVAYLVSQQADDGSWLSQGKPDPAITSLAVKCLIHHRDFGPDHPRSMRGLDFVRRFIQPDGGIYIKDQGLRNYYTSVALMAFAASADPKDRTVIHGAQKFLKELQWDGGEAVEASNPWYGGQGYGRHQRPDLSNTQLMLEALQQSGLPEDDPVYKKALRFVSRSQMLAETNDQAFAAAGGDGGFIYTPANGGESKAGEESVDGHRRLRSYGSMTYAGFKSLLYAKVDRDDPRVRKAFEWIRDHYTLDSNPNMPGARSKEGLYYFYHIFARALDAYGLDIIKDGENVEHRWRDELCYKLIGLQQEDGSWVNEQDRWFEGNPHLVTAYSVLAMQTAVRKANK